MPGCAAWKTHHASIQAELKNHVQWLNDCTARQAAPQLANASRCDAGTCVERSDSFAFELGRAGAMPHAA